MIMFTGHKIHFGNLQTSPRLSIYSGTNDFVKHLEHKPGSPCWPPILLPVRRAASVSAWSGSDGVQRTGRPPPARSPR